MITYSEFLRIRREEGRQGTLTTLTDKTLEEMKDYIAINKRTLDDAKKLGDERRVAETSEQINNALATLEQIMDIRLRKLAQIAISGTELDALTRQNLTSRELLFFDNTVREVSEHKRAILGDIKNVQPKETVKQAVEDNDTSEREVVKMLAEVPKFIWKNNKSYGPFSFSNVVELDKEVAEILVKGGKAERL